MEQLRFVARAAGADSSLLVAEAAQALSMFAGDPQALLVACKQLLTRQPTVGGLWWLCSRMLAAPDARAEARVIANEVQSDPTAKTLADVLVSELSYRDVGADLDQDGRPRLITEGSPSDDGRGRVVTMGWPDIVVSSLASSGVSALIIEVDGMGPGVARRLERVGVEVEAVAAERMAGAVAAGEVAVVEAAAAGSSTALVDLGGLSMAAVARAVATPVWLVVPSWRILPDALWPEIVAARNSWPGPPWTASSELLPLELVDRVISGKEITPLSADTGQSPTLTSTWSAAPELLGLVAARRR